VYLNIDILSRELSSNAVWDLEMVVSSSVQCCCRNLAQFQVCRNLRLFIQKFESLSLTSEQSWLAIRKAEFFTSRMLEAGMCSVDKEDGRCHCWAGRKGSCCYDEGTQTIQSLVFEDNSTTVSLDISNLGSAGCLSGSFISFTAYLCSWESAPPAIACFPARLGTK